MTGHAETSPYVAFEDILKRYHSAVGPSQLDGPLDADAVLNDENGLLVQLQQSLEDYLRANGATSTQPGTLPSEEWQWLLLEHRTWGLVRAVYENRLGASSGPSSEDVLASDPYISPMDLTQSIVNDDPDLSLWATLVEHLQTRPLFSSPPPIEARHGYIPTTMRAAKKAKLTGGASGSYDPDFTLREDGGQLAGEDSTYQNPLLNTLWDLIRYGELDHAVRICEEGGEPWRAASIMGGRRWDMGGLTTDRPDLTPLSGNRSRALWKRSCRAIAKNATLSNAERRLYAALVTDLPTLLPSCDSWEDQLWAHIVHRLEARIDQRLKDLGGFWAKEDMLLGTDEEATIELGRGGLEEVFASIASQSNVADASRNPLYVTQKQILLNHTTAHLDTFADRLPTLHSSVPELLIGPLLRFFSHLVLVLRTLSQPVPESASNAILESYLTILERGGHSSLVAPYAACLREGNGEESYARFLRSMPPSSPIQEKREALLRARDYGLDVAVIATETVRMTLHGVFEAVPSLNPSQPDITSIRVGVSAEEEGLIRALEWLTIVKETLPEALARSNDVARYFLALGQANAAGALLRSLPDEVGEVGEEDGAEDGARTEFEDYLKLFEVFDAHEAIDVVAAAQPKETASKIDHHNWRKRLLAAIEHVDGLTTSVLTSGWLIPSSSSSFHTGGRAYASQRRKELRRIRAMFVPDLVLRLHERLVGNAERFPHLLGAAFKLVELTAAQEYKVYEEFMGRQGSLENYLDKVRQASMLALEGGSGDPFKAPE